MLHVPGGILSERIGGKPVIVAALLLSAILSILTPLIVHRGGAAGLIVLRITLGCVQAGFFPAVATMLSAWVPKNERGRIGSLVYCGIPVRINRNREKFFVVLNSRFSFQFGAIVGNFMAGILLHGYQNWHAVFYICGTVGAILAFLFVSIK